MGRSSTTIVGTVVFVGLSKLLSDCVEENSEDAEEEARGRPGRLGDVSLESVLDLRNLFLNEESDVFIERRVEGGRGFEGLS